jgi:hypothetical protein
MSTAVREFFNFAHKYVENSLKKSRKTIILTEEREKYTESQRVRKGSKTTTA